MARLSAGTADLDGLRSEIAAPAETLARVAIDFTTLGADSTLVFVPSTQSATLVATAEPETFVVAGLQAPVVIQDFDPAKDALQFSAAQFTDAAAVRAAFAMPLAAVSCLSSSRVPAFLCRHRRLSAPAQRRVVRHAQLEPEQLQQAPDERLSLTQGEVEHEPQRQNKFDC